MSKSILLLGLAINLIASIMISYGRIFRSKKTIKKESLTDGHENIHEEKHRLIETRIAQAGAVLLSARIDVRSQDDLGKDVHLRFGIWIFCKEEQWHTPELVYTSNHRTQLILISSLRIEI